MMRRCISLYLEWPKHKEAFRTQIQFSKAIAQHKFRDNIKLFNLTKSATEAFNLSLQSDTKFANLVVSLECTEPIGGETSHLEWR
jgi:hypothetical protein